MTARTADACSAIRDICLVGAASMLAVAIGATVALLLA